MAKLINDVMNVFGSCGRLFGIKPVNYLEPKKWEVEPEEKKETPINVRQRELFCVYKALVAFDKCVDYSIIYDDSVRPEVRQHFNKMKAFPAGRGNEITFWSLLFSERERFLKMYFAGHIDELGRSLQDSPVFGIQPWKQGSIRQKMKEYTDILDLAPSNR